MYYMHFCFPFLSNRLSWICIVRKFFCDWFENDWYEKKEGEIDLKCVVFVFTQNLYMMWNTCLFCVILVAVLIYINHLLYSSLIVSIIRIFMHINHLIINNWLMSMIFHLGKQNEMSEMTLPLKAFFIKLYTLVTLCLICLRTGKKPSNSYLSSLARLHTVCVACLCGTHPSCLWPRCIVNDGW